MKRSMLVSAATLLAVANVCAPAAAQMPHANVIGEREITAPATPGYEAPEPGSLGGPFAMTEHTGRAVTDETYRGKWLLIYFGFTGCREACPVGLTNMQAALDELGTDQAKLQPIFVDFSMEAPDYKGLAQFVTNFHPRLIGLAGTRKQTFDILRKFKVRREYTHAAFGKKETGPRIDHTTYLFLVDPEGKTRAYFYHSKPPAEMAAIIRKHVK